MDSLKKFNILVVGIGGGWKQISVDSLKEAKERAYLNCIDEKRCRYASISQLTKNGSRLITYMASFQGRVWISDNRDSMSKLWWQGVIPTPEEAKEITGKYQIPLNYSI